MEISVVKPLCIQMAYGRTRAGQDAMLHAPVAALCLLLCPACQVLAVEQRHEALFGRPGARRRGLQAGVDGLATSCFDLDFRDESLEAVFCDLQLVLFPWCNADLERLPI